MADNNANGADDEQNDFWAGIIPKSVMDKAAQDIAQAQLGALKGTAMTNALLGQLIAATQAQTATQKKTNTLLRQIARTLDVQLVVGNARLPFGDGMSETKPTDLTGGTDFLFKNTLERPVRARVRVFSVGEGSLDIQQKNTSVPIDRLDMTILYSESREIVLMPNAELWGASTNALNAGRVVVEVLDYAAWVEHHLSRRPGSKL